MDSLQGSLENMAPSSLSIGNKQRSQSMAIPEGAEKQPSEITLIEHLNLLQPNNPYYELDERRHAIRHKIKEKFKDAPKTVLDVAEEEKPAIEKRLEDTDKALGDLLSFGEEIITNIKVANEKRELLRREFEEGRKENLKKEINSESVEATAMYDNIVARWSELGELKEPIVIFNKLEQQKTRIEELMRSKEEMIAACQREIDRMNERFQEDQRKQQTDICALVERIDGQVELLKKAYKHHLDLLQDTIESERQTIALKEQTKWNDFYTTMQDNEQYKLDVAREKKQFYASEIQRITAQQEEITRATRIRLEKDAEMLECELRNTKNQVLMNSEKLDYNYQVLQKRNEENVIINNQQKRRVAKLSEAISDMKKRIQITQANAQQTTTKLTNDIQKLHDSITELEKKSDNFRLSNRKKFFNIWNINYEEIRSLIEKVFDIDRILYEHQLGLPWVRPDVDLSEFPLVAKEKGLVRLKHSKSNAVANQNMLLNGPNHFMGLKNEIFQCSSSKEKLEQNKKQVTDLAHIAEIERKRQEERTEVRLLRNILRILSDRGRFMIEDRLLEFLEPYSKEQQDLVRIDNIFAALRITDLQAIDKLIQYFKPYAWCPNCMKGVSREQLKKLYADCHKFDEQETSSIEEESCHMPPDSCSDVLSISETTNSEDQNKQLAILNESTSQCKNHYLIIESCMVITALNDFTHRHYKSDQEHVKSINQIRLNKASKDLGKAHASNGSVEVDSETITKYWRKFLDFMPNEKIKLWHSLEHGLQHYLEVLKQREQLDKECAFLRRQNAELKYLLQKFEI